MIIKVLSWNILANEFIKKSYYPNLDINLLNNRNERIKIILNKLLNENPDIILLQEVMISEYNYLKKYLKKIYYFSKLIKINWDLNKYKNTESGNIILYKKICFHKKNNSYDLIFDNKIYGICIETQIKNDKNDKKIKFLRIFNLHLDDTNWQTRLSQINLIRPQLEKIEYCIIGGDFNQQFNKSSKIYNIDKFTVTNTKNITYYIEKNMNIDNIFVKKNIFLIKNNMVNELKLSKKEIFSKYGSDHLPVIVTLMI